jgi:hypothetical protein
MPFSPDAHQTLIIGGARYTVAEHPSIPGYPYGQLGRRATVFQLSAVTDSTQNDQQHRDGRRALKVFKAGYRAPSPVVRLRTLAALANLPGMRAGLRTILTGERHRDLLRQYPELRHAILMPWIDGPPWAGIVLEQTSLSPSQCLTLARSLAKVVSTIEQRGVAHCDLSGSNVLVSSFGQPAQMADNPQVALVGLEHIWSPDCRPPRQLPTGSPGYAHRSGAQGLWDSSADRFAGAVLLAEMLTWFDERVRNVARGETYFDVEELHGENDRFRLLTALFMRIDHRAGSRSGRTSRRRRSA